MRSILRWPLVITITAFNLFAFVIFFFINLEMGKIYGGISKSDAEVLQMREYLNENTARFKIKSKYTSYDSHEYSKASCLGINPDDDIVSVERRSCIFENVCVDLEENARQLIYFEKEDQPTLVRYDQEGFIRQENRSGDYVSFSSKPRVEWEDYPRYYAFINITNTKMFKEDSRTKYYKHFSVMSDSFLWNNLGHVLFDAIFPVFHSMLEHNHFEENVHVFFSRDFNQLSRFWKWCKIFNEGRFFDMDNMQKMFPQTKYLCFKKLMIGAPYPIMERRTPNKHWSRSRSGTTDNESGSTNGMSKYLWKFRFYMLKRRFGSNFVKSPPQRHQITIFKKKGRRSINNFDEMTAFIQNKYGKEMAVKVVNPAKLSIKEQILLMLETTLLISPCGGISMIGFFLPHGSSIITTDFVGYNNQDKTFTNDHMDAHFWNSLFWIDDYYIDVEKDSDYSSLFEENEHDYKDIRDNFEIEVNLQRLDYLIDVALRKMSN